MGSRPRTAPATPQRDNRRSSWADRSIQASAAADMFATTATVSFLPLIFGLLIALLAAVWRIGIDLRDDVEATI